MNEQESSPTSWILRTHFSRTIFYRPETCYPCPKEVTFLPARSKAKELHNDPLSIQKSHRLDASSGNTNKGETTQGVDFSFPSPFSSSSVCGLSDSPLHSKSTLDCFSPSSDEDVDADATPPPRPSHMGSNGFLRSMLNSLSITSSRWSVSTDSCNENQEHSPNSSFKGGSWFSWLSPKASPTSSPRVSPAVSPRGSPRRSFNYSTNTRVPVDKEDLACSENKSDMRRVPSWSQHLSNAGNERAVLSLEKWMIDLSQLLLGERFAVGNHSRLYHGMYKDSAVAVKVIRQPDADSLLADRLEQIFTNEVTTLAILQHRHIIKFVAACKKPPVLCVITEYLSGGSVRSFLHKREGELLPISQVLRMALNIASGMEYLHMKGIIHRDLKSENLVLRDDGCVKILDFGVSCFESHCDYKTDDPGTYRWMAPEMLCHKPYTRKVDVYSFGIVLWELLTARVPYEEMGAVQAAFCVLHKNMRPSVPSNCPPALDDLMRNCWSAEPNERPEFWEIMRSLTICEQSLYTSEIPTFESPQHYSSMPTWLQSE